MPFCNELKFLSIALRFHSLVEAKGLLPWSPLELDCWACEFDRSSQAIHSVRFILGLWNSGYDWECGTFDPRIAVRAWDIHHRRVYLEIATEHLGYSA